MGTIVDATVPTEQFALRDTFDEIPDAEFETVRVVAHEAGHVMPFLWSTASDLDGLQTALERDSTTQNVTRLARSDGRCLYQMEWRAHIRVVVYVLVEEQGTLLGAHGRGDRWKLRVLFPDHDSVSSTYDFCKEYGIDLSIRRVNGVTDSITHGGVGLSEQQHEALTAAYESGYYGVPRKMTLEELATQLDVSHQALSERLRRGHRNVIASTLFDAPERVEHEL